LTAGQSPFFTRGQREGLFYEKKGSIYGGEELFKIVINRPSRTKSLNARKGEDPHYVFVENGKGTPAGPEDFSRESNIFILQRRKATATLFFKKSRSVGEGSLRAES